jgi:lipid-A-disaccharide synthase
MPQLYIIAGEISGDTHGAGLIREIQALNPEVAIHGLGGSQMRAAAGSGITDWVEKAGVVGLWEVVKMYGYFKTIFDSTVSSILSLQPEAVILVDYPGFNLRVSKALREKGYKGKIIYYISPQVWAWKKGRVKTMAKVLDLMICIFPFEVEFYGKSGLHTVFCGHPLVDRTEKLRRNWEREKGLVGWFPGSRTNEVKRLFPIMMKAAAAIKAAQPNVRFVVSAANETLAGKMREMAESAGMPDAKKWIETGTVYDLMQRVQVGAVASGTATLEAACFGLPYVLVYKVNAITYSVAKTLVKIENIGIVNVLAKREAEKHGLFKQDVVKELVQGDLTPDTLAAAMVEMLIHESSRRDLQRDLAEVVATLGEPGAYRRAAEAVMKVVV